MFICLIIKPDKRIVCERPLAKAIIRQLDMASNDEAFCVYTLVKLDADFRAKRNRIVARNKNT